MAGEGLLLHCAVPLLALLFRRVFLLYWSCPAGGECDFTPDTFPDRGEDLAHLWGSQRFQIEPNAVLEIKSKIRAGLSRSNPVAIHIGPSTLWGEKGWYAELLAQGPYRAIFVEPNPAVQSKLQDTIDGLAAKGGKFEIVNAAVCPTATGNVSFWTPAQKLFDDYIVLRTVDWMVQEWVSLNRENLMLTINHAKLGITIPESEWPLYSQETSVRCVTPRSLLEELGLDPADVRLLIVDAEGYDADIVEKFLELKGLRPEYLQFEWLLSRSYEQLLKVISAMAARNYTAHRINQDIQAVLSD